MPSGADKESSTATNTAADPSFQHEQEIPSKRKKSRRERKEAAKAKQQRKQQQRSSTKSAETEKTKDDGSEGESTTAESTTSQTTNSNQKESPDDRFERLRKEFDVQSRPQPVTPLSKNINASEPKQSPQDFLQYKVKCPLDKKPGDVLTFSNPHIPGTKHTVVIPTDVTPGKSFKIMVPLPPKLDERKKISFCCVCSRQLHGISTEDYNDNNEGTRSDFKALRACVHVSCPACFSSVQGKACPICASPLPTLESLDHLPFVQDLNNSISVKEALLEEFYLYKESMLRDGDNPQKRQALAEASAAAQKAIEKYYRRASIEVHPDRLGESFRPAFDRLTKARDILRDNLLRSSYVSELLEIVCKVDIAYVVQSQSAWLAKHDPDARDQARRFNKPTEAGKKETALYLEGGLASSKLKRPSIVIKVSNDTKRIIDVSLPIRKEQQFLNYCTRITIVGTCGRSCVS